MVEFEKTNLLKMNTLLVSEIASIIFKFATPEEIVQWESVCKSWKNSINWEAMVLSFWNLPYNYLQQSNLQADAHFSI